MDDVNERGELVNMATKATKAKKTAEEIKKEISETATKIAEAGDDKKETVKETAKKAEPVKETAVKATETAKKTTAAKAAPAAEKKAEEPAKKTATKKTSTPAKAAKKDIVKSAFLQDNYGNSKTYDDIVDGAIANFKETHKRVAVTKIEVYIKAADNKVYYVVNEEHQGEMNLF